MAFTFTVTDNDAHSATVSKSVIGRAGEAGEVMTVNISSTLGALGYPAYMHFLLPNGDSVYKGPYVCSTNTFSVTIGATDNVLAYEGNLVIQMVLQNGTTVIWKSEEKTVKVNPSINATQVASGHPVDPHPIPTTYPADDVTIVDSESIIAATNVEDALEEITNKADGMYINAQYPPYPLVGIDLSAADNSVAINAMITSLNPGGEIFFPIGTCKITSPIIMNKNQIALKGCGQRSIIQNDGTGDAIQMPGTIGSGLSRIRLEGIRIVGNVDSGYGLLAEYVGTRLIIRDCEFYGHGKAGAFLNNCYSNVIDSSNFSSNCNLADPVKHAGLILEYSHNFVVHGCHFTNNQTLSDGFRASYCVAGTVDGCQMEDNTNQGFQLLSCKGITMNGLYVENNGGTFGGYIIGTAPNPSKSITINSSIFNGAAVNTYGLAIEECEAVVLNSLYCYRNVAASIRVAATAVNTIINNITTSITPSDTDPSLLSDVGVGTLYNLGNIVQTDLEVASTKYFKLSSYWMWVDATGDLRICATLPTSDTDGTVVGTQS